MRETTPSTQDIVRAAASSIFGKPLVTNVYRSVIVEAIVDAALPEWNWCSVDYAAYDFERAGVRLEVKQTAVRQSWSAGRLSKPSWDIASRTGYFTDGTLWTPFLGRNADLYVLGLHPVEDDTADHCDPLQWRFYVIAAQDLPDQKRIGQAAASRLSDQFGFHDLHSAVDAIAERLPGRVA